MNATVYGTTDVDLELDNLVSLDESYETTPILAITPIPQRPDEAMLHTQFEEALHERAGALGSHLQGQDNKVAAKHSLQRVLIYSCCALSCILLGFDLMGLLVLHVR